MLITENEMIRLDVLTFDEFIEWIKAGDDDVLDEQFGQLLADALAFLRRLS